MKLKLKKHWATGEIELEMFITVPLRYTDKLNYLNIGLGKRFQALQNILNEEEATVKQSKEHSRNCAR